MKKFLKLFALTMAILLLATTFAACGGGDYTTTTDIYDTMQASTGLSFKSNLGMIDGIGTCTDTDIVIPKKIDNFIVNFIGGFSGNKNITSVIIPNGIMEIRQSAFKNCSSLKEVTLPDTLTEIGNNAFESCSSLEKIKIPNGLSYIHRKVFANCISLKEVTIDTNIVGIAPFAFYGCTSLTDINFVGTKAQWENIQKTSNWDEGIDSYTVHCSDGDITK